MRVEFGGITGEIDRNRGGNLVENETEMSEVFQEVTLDPGYKVGDSKLGIDSMSRTLGVPERTCSPTRSNSVRDLTEGWIPA